MAITEAAPVADPLEVKEEAKDAPELPAVADEIEREATPDETDTNQDAVTPEHGMQQLDARQNRLQTAEKNLNQAINDLERKKSLFSRAATFWGRMRTWQKCVGALLAAIPAFIVGMFVASNILITLLIATLAIYALAAFLLENHHRCNVDIATRLKEGLLSLANVFGTTITVLDKIRNEWLAHVKHAGEEKGKLTDNVDALNADIDAMRGQIDLFAATTAELQSTKEELEATAQLIQESLDAEDALLLENQETLTLTTEDYHKDSAALMEKNRALAELRADMSLKVEQARGSIDILHASLTTLQQKQQHAATDKTASEQEFNAMLSAHQIYRDECMKSIADEQVRLAALVEGLKRRTAKYRGLVHSQSQQTEALEALSPSKAASPGNPSQVGFYSGRPILDLTLPDNPNDNQLAQQPS